MAGIGMNWFEWLEIAGNIWKWLEMTNHHDKQLTPSESWDQDGFFEPGFGYHQLQIIGLEFLQRCGHQIRVNTWTGSYVWTILGTFRKKD